MSRSRPARLDGERARLLFNPVTLFPVARALRSDEGASIGEVFSFLPGLYFRVSSPTPRHRPALMGKPSSGVFVITTNRGLLPASTRVTLDDLAAFAAVGIDDASGPFRATLQVDAEALAQALGRERRTGSVGQHRQLEVRRRAAVRLWRAAPVPRLSLSVEVI